MSRNDFLLVAAAIVAAIGLIHSYLGERLGRAGWSNVYVPRARVTHVGGTSWRERPARMISAHHASAARYVGRRYPHAWQWPVRVAVGFGLRLRERAEIRAAAH